MKWLAVPVIRATALALGVASVPVVGTLDAIPARAANGDLVHEVVADRTGTACASVNPAGSHLGVGVGIAFDGSRLLISCAGDSTITEIHPVTGARLAIHTVAGATSLGAMAWAASSGQLWACSTMRTVGTVDLGTNTFTPRFQSQGCFDGLAYDGADNTIWASEDVSSSVQHYALAGALIASHALGGRLGACGNSGIAAGGSRLYLANNGCSQIYDVAKDFSAATLVVTSARRLEDLECDDVTFGAQGKGVLWSIDAYDNVLDAWEIPLGQCPFGGQPLPIPPPIGSGSMKGSGSLFTEGGVRVSHHFDLGCSGAPDRLEVTWAKENKFKLETLSRGVCTDGLGIAPDRPAAAFDTHLGSGQGRLNGAAGATATWRFTDAGEPGKSDYATIIIRDAGGATVLTVSGTLDNGNHQAHRK